MEWLDRLSWQEEWMTEQPKLNWGPLSSDLYWFCIFWGEKNHCKIFCSETEMSFEPRWLPLLLAEISNGKKKKNRLTFRSRIETRWADYRHLRPSSIYNYMLYWGNAFFLYLLWTGFVFLKVKVNMKVIEISFYFFLYFCRVKEHLLNNG
jgi:hypothetical protein